MSESALAAALAAAQAEISDPERGRAGQVRGRSGYRYAGLDDLLRAVRPALSRHGLAVTSRIVVGDLGPTLVSELLHASGEVLVSTWPLLWPDGPQDRGSELTYARRYTIEALVGVAPTDEDDDGRAAQVAPPPAPRPPTPTREEVVAQVVDQLVAQGWPRETVTEDIREHARGHGVSGDPWAAATERLLRLPQWAGPRIGGAQ